MQIRPEQLAAHLARGPGPLYTVWGSEPLGVQEAGDAIRAAARAAGCDERVVFTVSGAHFDWSAVAGAAQSMSLFSAARLIEIRIPSGKPGKEGAAALKAYAGARPEGVTTLVTLPRLDRMQQQSAWFTALDAAGVTVRIDDVERSALPAWIARRLAAQGQHMPGGEAGERALAFFADRVEGNLLAAHQEVQKLALLCPPGPLSVDQVEAAVLDVARFEIDALADAVLAGDLRRALRLLDSLRAEGESAVFVHWRLAEDLRALRRVRAALARGLPPPMALREARVWGRKERLVERAAGLVDEVMLDALVAAASRCDGIVKGLRHPDWPDDAWAALGRLVLMTVQALAPRPPRQRPLRFVLRAR
jgi:DNA polymerase-3 subunit delta